MIICLPKAVTSGITVSNQLIGDTHVGSNPAQVQMTKIAKPVREHSLKITIHSDVAVTSQ